MGFFFLLDSSQQAWSPPRLKEPHLASQNLSAALFLTLRLRPVLPRFPTPGSSLTDVRARLARLLSSRAARLFPLCAPAAGLFMNRLAPDFSQPIGAQQ